MSSFYQRVKRLGALACISVQLATFAHAAEPLPPAKEIRAVLNMRGQPCNGNFSSTLSAHPQEAEIMQTRLVALPEVNMNLAVPQLPGISETALRLVMNTTSRQVKEHYLLLSGHEWDTPAAVIVITELPSEIKTEAETFEVVEYLTKGSAKPAGVNPFFHKMTGPHGNAIEVIAPGRISSHCFPTSDWKLAEGSAKDSTFGISRFIVKDRHLIEYAMILKVGPQQSIEEQAAYARKIMDRFWLSLQFKKASQESTHH